MSAAYLSKLVSRSGTNGTSLVSACTTNRDYKVPVAFVPNCINIRG